MARIFSDVQDFLSGIKVIKAWNLLPYCRQRFICDYEEYRAQSLNEIKYNSAIDSVLGLVIVLVLNLILYVAVIEITMKHTTPGDYAGFILALWLFLQPIKKIGMGYSSLVNATVAAERVLGVLKNDALDETNLENGVQIDSIERIELLDAVYDFNGRTIAEGVCMTFEPSKVYAIVGPNGAGKSTIIESLIGFARPSSGQVLINGLPLDRCNISSVRSRISLVLQDTFLFHSTIRENIIFSERFDSIASKERYERVLGTAHIYDYLAIRGRDDSAAVSERGSNFSGGEKQRLCIARALCKEYDALILDEPNANLSKDVFAEILDTICQQKEGKIIILITHDPIFWHYGDVIYEVSDGRVVAVPREGLPH